MESIIARPRRRSITKSNRRRAVNFAEQKPPSHQQTNRTASTMPIKAPPQKNLPLGVFKLARLHTLESLLCVYPAIWGASLSASRNGKNFTASFFFYLLAANWASMTIAHMTFCTFNDIIDRNFDSLVERTKTRPLPAGLISVRTAWLAFLIELSLTIYLTNALLGPHAAIVCTPIWLLSTIYPFMKRIVSWPQLILGPTIGMAVLPGWVSVTGSWEGVGDAIPLVAATSVWVVYFDTVYATQDTKDDRKAGVKSLAILLRNHMHEFLGSLGMLQVALLAYTARQADVSLVFWVFGVVIWGASIPFQLATLDVKRPKTGGKVFLVNILMGMWVTMVSIFELWVGMKVKGLDLGELGGRIGGLGVGRALVMVRELVEAVAKAE